MTCQAAIIADLDKHDADVTVDQVRDHVLQQVATQLDDLMSHVHGCTHAARNS
jgi:hypothetical protein